MELLERISTFYTWIDVVQLNQLIRISGCLLPGVKTSYFSNYLNKVVGWIEQVSLFWFAYSLIENVDATLFFNVFSGYMFFGVIFFARFYKLLFFN